MPRIRPSASAAMVTVQRSARDDVAATRFSRRSSIHLIGTPRWYAGEEHDLLVAREVRLLAEAAADVAHAHPDAPLGHAGDAAGHGADVVWRLGRDPDVERAAPPVPRRDDAAGLHRHREIAVLDERLGDDVRRASRRSLGAPRRRGTGTRPRGSSHGTRRARARDWRWRSRSRPPEATVRPRAR